MDDIDVDDLFGSDNVLGLDDPTFDVPHVAEDVAELPVQPTIPPPELIQHVNDLRGCGCLQRISWSRQGCIAIISSDSLRVLVCSLRFDTIEGKWSLSETSLVNSSDFDQPITHVQWSPSGADLTVIDSIGRASIFTVALISNRMTLARPASFDMGDGLNQVVGLVWLNQDRGREMVLQSSKDEQTHSWKHIMTKRLPHGPHAIRALVLVMRNGSLRFIYQLRPDLRWSEITTTLHPQTSALDYLTHAAIASTTDGKLFTVVHSGNRKLSAYLVHVTVPDPKSAGPDTVPNIEFETIELGIANDWTFDTNTANGVFGGDMYGADVWNLTHLDIFPTSDLEKSIHRGPPTIFAVFTSVIEEAEMGFSTYPVSSTIRRWTLQTTDKNHEIQKLQPDVRFDHVITSFQLVDNSQLLAITQHNGDITLWKPDNMTQAFMEEEAHEALSMSQSGFTFPPTVHPYQLAFSPTASSYIALDPVTGVTQRMNMAFTGHQQNDDNAQIDPSLDAALASVVLAFTRGVLSSSNTDDLLTCVLDNFQQQQINQLLSHMYHILFRDIDLVGPDVPGTDIDKLYSKLMAVKVLSFQAGLGYAQALTIPSTVHRNPSSRLAWLVLHLRHIAILFYYFMSLAKQPQPAPTNGAVKPESPLSMFHRDFINFLAANVKWLLDLYKYILDGLIEDIERDQNPTFFANTSFHPDNEDEQSDTTMQLDHADRQRQRQEREDLAVLLLMSSWPRYFAKLAIKLIRMTLSPPVQGAPPAFPVIAEAARVNGVAKGLGILGVEKMLDVARVTLTGSVSIEERARLEVEVLTTGRVPDEWRRVVKGWMREGWTRSWSGPEMAPLEIDRLKLFMAGAALRWEEIGIEGVDGKGRAMDVHRKFMINGHGIVNGRMNGEMHEERLKTCSRCGGRYEDGLVGRDWNRVLAGYMTKQLSKCVCEGAWMVGQG